MKPQMGKNLARKSAATMAAGLLTVSLASCGQDSGGTQSGPESEVNMDLSGQNVRLGTAAEQPLDIGTSYAVELLEGWGAEVQREELTSLSGLEAIIADQIDVSGRSSDEVVAAAARDVDLVAFGAGASAMHYVLIGSPGITELSDLEGQSIAISGPSGFDTILINAILDEQGLDPDNDVTMIPIGGSGERTSAVLAEQADVAMVFMDNWLALEAEGADVGLIGYVADILPGLSSRAYAAERSYLDNNEDMALAIACANLEANRWINDNRDEYIDYTLERVTGTTSEGLGAFYDQAMEINMFPTDPAEMLRTEAFQGTADLMAEAGNIDEEVDADNFVDRSYLEEAAEMGCGQR